MCGCACVKATRNDKNTHEFQTLDFVHRLTIHNQSLHILVRIKALTYMGKRWW